MSNEETAANALAAVMDVPIRDSPLGQFPRPRYIMREMHPKEYPDGRIALTLYKWGWNYKFRGKRPFHTPPKADTQGITRYLQTHPLFPYQVISVEDNGKYITIFLWRNGYENI